ncbi:MAG: sterol desaturase family protein [Planctomycetota bacterium]|nr:sterol desaturase family protein [Planctomycetota bacterium]
MTIAAFATEHFANHTDWLPRVVGLRLTLPLVLLVTFWIWETLRPFFQLQRNRHRHAVRNLTVALMNAAVIGLLFGTATVLTSHWAVESRIGLLHLTDGFAVGRFAAGLILLDAWMFVWHWLNHRVPLLWRFHRMHHSDPDMDVTTATRFHLGEHVISASLRLMLIPVIGLSVWQIVVYEMAVIATTHFHHANISVGRADRWLRCLVVTPDMHKVHHSRWQPETDSNFAVVLSIWDRLAQTFRLNSDPHSIAFGLDEFANERWQSIGGMLRTPFAGKGSRQRFGNVDDEPQSQSEVSEVTPRP